MTFEAYLNEAVGKRWMPPIEFKMIVSENPLLDWLAKDEDEEGYEEIDFMYTTAGVYSCIAAEIGAQPLGTTVSQLVARGIKYELDMYAGENTEVGKERMFLSAASILKLFWCFVYCRCNDGSSGQ